MATLAPITSPTRRPFASLDGARLRNLTNVKNRQNALNVPSFTPMKRPRSPDDFSDVDTENIDPEVFSSPSKKAKKTESFSIGPVKTARSSKFVLKQVHSTTPISSRVVATPKRLSISTTNTLPNSAPTVSGRSPKSKRAGILSRRRVSSSPFTRVDPPSFGGSNVTGNGLPFSIDAALSGTVSSYTPNSALAPVTTLEDSVPGGWLFSIHEDTPDEELGNLVQFSTQTLDISDDESRECPGDEREKENIPPSEIITQTERFLETSVSRAISRQDMMIDEARKPLEDLDAREYYADGCDTDSFVIVPEEIECTEIEKSPFVFNGMKKSETPSPVGPSCNQDVWKELLAKVNADSSASGDMMPASGMSLNEMTKADSPIEIWESESAKGEDRPAQEDFLP